MEAPGQPGAPFPGPGPSLQKPQHGAFGVGGQPGHRRQDLEVVPRVESKSEACADEAEGPVTSEEQEQDRAATPAT